MRRKSLVITIVVLLLFSIALPAYALKADSYGDTTVDLTGRHFTLNIIGMNNPKNVDMDKASGNVIFVPIASASRTKILLEKGDFAVLDGNGTDGEATFRLPDPGYEPYNVRDSVYEPVDTVSDYSIFVRPLGKPGGWSTITTCAELIDEDDLKSYLTNTFKKILNELDVAAYVSIEQVGKDITFREKGKTTFTNVTAEMTSIVFAIAVDTDADGVADYTEYIRVPIFDEMLQGEYWAYEQGDQGLKLLQVRFYPFGTDVTGADDPATWDETWGGGAKK